MVKDNKASIGTMPLGEQQLKARDLPYAETSAWKVQIGMPQWKSLLYRERQKAEVRNERMERGYPVFYFYFLLVPGKNMLMKVKATLTRTVCSKNSNLIGEQHVLFFVQTIGTVQMHYIVEHYKG